MKISTKILRRFVVLPEDARDTRMLLDDIGIEVKRFDAESGLFTLELLANRGDHHSYTGLAREIGGRTGDGICGPIVAPLQAGEHPHPLVLKTVACPLYSATLLVRDGDAGALANDVTDILNAAEIHTVSPAVDATNIANLELGQPTHCFDADTIKGPITIREASTGELAWPLFAEEKVTVPEGTIVIADDEKILAIAGVIGCEESKTTEQTTRILLESAAFEPISVRKASRALDIHTDSSARFERGSDPSQVLTGAGRVVQLLEGHGWRREGDTGVVGDWTDEQRSIGIETADACTFLDHPLDDAEITDRLGRYGFVVTGSAGKLSVRVPPHRVWDVEFTADLYEELAKSIGYNNTATNLPDVDMGALPSAAEAMKARVEDVLLGAGMYEVFTNGFHGTDMRDRLGLEPTHVLSSYVQTTNALDRGYGLIKNNGLAQAVEAVATNTRAGTRPISMYEWTRTFHLDASASNGVCSERHLLWAIAAGSTEIDRWSDTARQASPWFFKGLVEEIATTLQLPISVGPADSAHPLSDCMHPGRCAAIQLGCKTVGILGEVHPRIVSAFKLKRTRPVYMEIDREALKTTSTRTRYAERSVHQPIMRSLAFSLPTKITAGEVAETLRTHGPDWLEAVDIVDLFKHEEDGSPMRAITFALRYSNAQGDRSAEAVNAASEALISAIESAFGAQGVKLRA